MRLNFKRKALISLLLVICISGAGCVTISPVTPTATLIAQTQLPVTESIITPAVIPTETAISSSDAATVIENIVSTIEPYRLADYPSPDGNWAVVIDRFECSNPFGEGNTESIAYEQVRLVDLGTANETVVAAQIQNCDGLGAFGFEGMYWSPSNQYFYYDDSREGQPDGGCGSYLSLPMYRLDTETNEVIKLDGGVLSPDKTKFAMWHDDKIVIWDLDKGQIADAQPATSSYYNGQIWWSQDSRSILYLQTENQCAPDFGKAQITNFEIDSLSQKLVSRIEALNANQLPEPMAGELFLISYQPIVLNYDPDLWQDESLYVTGDSTINYLQAKELPTCYLSVLKSTSFTDHHSNKIRRLGKFNFTVTTLDFEVPPDLVEVYYTADQFIEGYNLSRGAPLLKVSALSLEWEQCQSLAEEVISTLHPSMP